MANTVPLSKLNDMFGLSGKVLERFRSYLQQCSQSVSVHGIYLMLSVCYLVYHKVQFLDLEHCIADIRLRMTQNLLKLNDNKTNIIYLASPLCVKSPKTPALQMGAYSITPNGSVKKYRGYYWINVLTCMKLSH